MAFRPRSLWPLVLATAGLACGKSADAGPAADDLQAARATWASAKPSCPEYFYIATLSSVFGSCSETKVDVVDDHPTGRSFTGFTYGTCGSDAGPSEIWQEAGAEIGTHADGAAALTVEQLFADCQTSLAQDPKQNMLTLVIGPHGVPIACGYRPNNCVDDCYVGFRLASFNCGPDPVDAAVH